MTLIVRNEADIIEDNLRYHRAQGVDFFIVLDNGSTDGTLEILNSYERSGIVTLVSMPGTMLTIQRKGNTRIARLAYEMGADWVIHNDADEFWWPVAGNLKDALETIPDDLGIVLAPRTEFLPRPDGPGSFAERMTVREARFRRPPKTAHRTHPSVKLWSAHPIDLWVKHEASPQSGLVGKPSLRVEARHREERELDLVLAPMFPVGVLHFPLRSFEQYRKKIADRGPQSVLGAQRGDSSASRSLRERDGSRTCTRSCCSTRRRSLGALPKGGWSRTGISRLSARLPRAAR